MKQSTKIAAIIVTGVPCFIIAGIVCFVGGMAEHPETDIVVRAFSAIMNGGFAGIIAAMICALLLFRK